MTKDEVLKLALEALENLPALSWIPEQERTVFEAIIALRTALEQPVQEPVAWMLKSGHGTEFNECIAEELKALTWKGKPMWVPLYTSPPQRKPLTEEEIAAIYGSDLNYRDGDYLRYARAIERAHGIGA